MPLARSQRLSSRACAVLMDSIRSVLEGYDCWIDTTVGFDENALLDLNKITHGAIKAEVLRRLEEKPKLAAIDAIALFEGGLAELCDVTVAVTAPSEIRVLRLMKRDNISEEYARSRIAAQHPDIWFRERCDCILENNGTETQFLQKCLAFLKNPDIMM